MSTIQTIKEVQAYTDEDGNTTQTTKETTRKVERSTEPDYIKLYTQMWCEFNQIPITWRPLFLELISKMTYCDSKDLKHSQIVQTGSIFGDTIRDNLGIGQRQYQKGLKALVDCGAIRKIENRRGVYQINPSYAGRGEWKYNPRLARGGVEDLKATFNFANHSVDLSVVWADDGTNNPMNEDMRKGLGVTADNGTVLKTAKIKKAKPSADEEIPELTGVM